MGSIAYSGQRACHARHERREDRSKRAHYAGGLLALTLLAPGAVPAQDGKDVEPGAAREGVVRVNAIKDPELKTYRAIAAGLDMFDDAHALAPKAPRLQFAVRDRRGHTAPGAPLAVKLSADGFDLPLPLDAAKLFVVPRDERAWDAKAELVVNRKRNAVRVAPYVRTPGLADNQYRLGDMRLECKVTVAIIKEEAPFWAVAMINTLLVSGDWCGFFKTDDRHWSYDVPADITKATLWEGNRSKALEVDDRHVKLPLTDPAWSDDAIVEVEFAPVPASAPAAVASSTGTTEAPAGAGH